MNVVTRREWIEVMGESTPAQTLWEGMLGPVISGEPSWRNASLDCPATCISAYAAEEYCRRVGGRLLTIAEYRACAFPMGVLGEWGDGPPIGGAVQEWVINPDAPQGTGSSGAYAVVDHEWWHSREYAERRIVRPADGAMQTVATGFRVRLVGRCADPRCENGVIVGGSYVANDGEVVDHEWPCTECEVKGDDDDIPF